MVTQGNGALPTLAFADQSQWESWLDEHHTDSPGVWLKIAKKTTDAPSVSYAEALESALCYGWIDGQKAAHDDEYWLQKFTPRRARSVWSRVNRDKATALIAEGRMRAAGQRQVDQAKADGRWEAAYDSQRAIAVPLDLQSALDAEPAAQEFFSTLDSHNRYAILYRVQTAKRAETRAARIQKFVAMLARGEKIYP
ncbi:MAG TPA: YdeI/OmpD-associated family protein [Ktedonobacterales bacterium]